MDHFKTKTVLKVGKKSFSIYSLKRFEKKSGIPLARLPYSIRILIENLLRNEDGKNVCAKDIEALAKWNNKRDQVPLDLDQSVTGPGPVCREIAFTPARVILQDFTGVPCVVDLAAMRDAIRSFGGNPEKINPLQNVDLVIDHSVQVDAFGSPEAFKINVSKEFERNQERYTFLRWGQQAFHNFRVVPPGAGIIHQVNLEYLASGVMTRLSSPNDFVGDPLALDSRLKHAGMTKRGKGGREMLAYPDTLVGTDSHTTMINGLGVLGWGVGGIEAEAAMLGQPVSMLIPEVVGMRLVGSPTEGVTATDVVLKITQLLRKKGVVGKFVEFFGPGLDELSLADRATIANMAPEYGATMGFFPMDRETITFLKLTGRPASEIRLVEAYTRAQGLFRTSKSPEPFFSDILELDLGSVEHAMAGPKKPHERVILKDVPASFRNAFEIAGPGSVGPGPLKNGDVVIASITSCTNTSNPAVMIAAGLVAKKAVEKGLTVKPWVKTSLAPGSQVVVEYLKAAGLLKSLEKLKFNLVGYGCMTCIGNSGPLPEAVSAAIKANQLAVVSVLSGNRNFEGRVNALVRANYLASPPLVVAYALAGHIGTDLTTEPLGKDSKGNPVYLKDLWPSSKEIRQAMKKVTARMFKTKYASVFKGSSEWRKLAVPQGNTFAWSPKSTYVKQAPYFDGMPREPKPVTDIRDARVLVMVGDMVTTDHISPAGSIPKDSPAGKYLMASGVEPKDFNAYGARRGNHEVMVRGTFANIRLKNLLLPGTEGGVTKFLPTGESLPIYDAAMRYAETKTPLIVLAGKEYGAGSSRDWAAKGPHLLGIRAAIAESFERIHRSNLIGMGILPLEFKPGQTAQSLGLTGEETYRITGIAKGLSVRKVLTVDVDTSSGQKSFDVISRIDTPVELAYYQHGGILQYVLRQLIPSSPETSA